MELNEYQQKAAEFAMYDDDFYPIASLMVEAAEFADLFIKPWLRGDPDLINDKEILSEAGDVLWQLSNAVNDAGFTLSEVAEFNLAKLKDRQERGVIQGKGGNR